VALSHKVSGETFALGSEEEGQRRLERHVGERRTAVGDEGDPRSRQGVPVHERHAEDPAGRRAERARTDWVGTARRERHRRVECVGDSDHGADVPGVGDLPESENDVAGASWQRIPAIDTDDARRMPKGRHLAEELRQDVIAGNQ